VTRDPLQRRWTAYRDLSEGVEPSPALTERILTTAPRRARTLRLIRNLRMGAGIAVLLAGSSALWAAVETSALEGQFAIQVGAWAEE
jgi:hypothetical protein